MPMKTSAAEPAAAPPAETSSSSMTAEDRDEITRRLRMFEMDVQPLYFEANKIGPICRNRLYWPTFRIKSREMEWTDKQGVAQVESCSGGFPPMEYFLDEGCTKLTDKPFLTAIRWRSDQKPFFRAGIDGCACENLI